MYCFVFLSVEKLCYTLYGILVFLPWNVTIMGATFFKESLATSNALTYASLTVQICQLAATTLSWFLPTNGRRTKVLLCMMIQICSFFMMIVWVAGMFPGSNPNYIVPFLILCGVCGVTSGVFQNTAMGEINEKGGLTWFCFGTNMSDILTCSVSLASLKMANDEAMVILASSATSVVLIILTGIAVLYLELTDKRDSLKITAEIEMIYRPRYVEKLCYILYGILVFLPWNVTVMGATFFKQNVATSNALTYASLTVQICQLAATILNLFLPTKGRRTKVLVCMMIQICSFLVMIAWVAGMFPGSNPNYIMPFLILCGVCGLTSGVFQNTAMEEISEKGGLAWFYFGINMSAILTCSVSVASLIMANDEAMVILASSATSLVLIILTGIVFLYVELTDKRNNLKITV